MVHRSRNTQPQHSGPWSEWCHVTVWLCSWDKHTFVVVSVYRQPDGCRRSRVALARLAALGGQGSPPGHFGACREPIEQRVVVAADVASSRLILSHVPGAILQSYADAILGPLDASDQPEQLLSTLSTFLESNGAYEVAAQAPPPKTGSNSGSPCESATSPASRGHPWPTRRFGVPPTFRTADRIGSASERNRGVGTKIREIQARVS